MEWFLFGVDDGGSQPLGLEVQGKPEADGPAGQLVLAASGCGRAAEAARCSALGLWSSSQLVMAPRSPVYALGFSQMEVALEILHFFFLVLVLFIYFFKIYIFI